jgi:hypothetical protein
MGKGALLTVAEKGYAPSQNNILVQASKILSTIFSFYVANH